MERIFIPWNLLSQAAVAMGLTPEELIRLKEKGEPFPV
jgi:hypothetical protein